MRYTFILLTLCLSLFSQSIDVILPVHKKDRDNLDIVIKAVRKNIIDCGRIIVVSKEKFTNSAEWIDEKDYPFSIEDVANEIGGEGGIGKNIRRGWYYQQLLKFYAHYVIDDLEEHILILDADTIPTHPMEFINSEGQPYMDVLKSSCRVRTYFRHIRKILPEGIEIDRGVNPIVHHMVFSKPIIDDLFLAVEDRFNKPFWKVFLNLVLPPNKCSDKQFYTGASEYMIYFYYCQNFHPEKVCIRYIKNRDRVTSLKTALPGKADFMSQHNYDRTE